jgi:hypothetical protein
VKLLGASQTCIHPITNGRACQGFHDYMTKLMSLAHKYLLFNLNYPNPRRPPPPLRREPLLRPLNPRLERLLQRVDLEPEP